MKRNLFRLLCLLLSLGLLGCTAFAEEFIEAEEAAVEEIFAVQSEEEPLEVQPEETFAVEELIPEESLETVEIAVEELTEAMTEASVPADPAAPAAVTGIKGVPVYTNAARISWDAMSGVTGFQLFRADKEDGEFKWVKNNPTTTVVNYVLTPGADYWYKVRAYTEDKDGKKQYGPFSDVVKVHNLGAIGNFTVQPKDTNCSFLQWDKVPGCTGYQVFRTVAGSGEYQWVKNATTNQVANYSLTPGTTYYYKLRAYVDLPDGSRAYGQYSDGIKVEIMDAAKITGAVYDGYITLTWEKQQNVTGYQVFCLVGGTTGATYTWLANTAGETYMWTGPTNYDDYYFKVRTYRDLDDGSRSYGQFSEAKHCAAHLIPYTFEVSGGQAVLTAYNGNDRNVVIPSTYCGKPVAGIGSMAFSNKTVLINVTIPASVTSIGKNVFYSCYNLERIDVVSGNPAYSSTSGVLYNKDKTELVMCPCGKTDSFSIPTGVKRIADNAFAYCNKLTRIVFPGSLTAIGSQAFFGCENVTAISLPASLTELAPEALRGMIRLTSISIASGNPAFASVNGVLYNKQKTALVAYPNGKAGSFTVLVGVTSIEDCAFSYCHQLTAITFPDGLVCIGNHAFRDCMMLQETALPDGVISIGEGAFESCFSFTNITIPASVKSIGDATFTGCVELTIHTPAGSYAAQYAQKHYITCVTE